MNLDRATLANWRTAPFNRWAFHHVRELMPTADIPNDPARVRPLPRGEAGFKDVDIEGFLRETDTDGIAILHRGKLVFERYANGMTDETPHILMSVSKSMLGLLVSELRLDTERRVTDIVPELAATAYRGATLRHLLDMRTGIAWDEDYLATSGPIVEYRKATGWNPLGAGETAADLNSFFLTLEKSEGAHGGRFHYTSPNSDLLGWVIDRLGAPRCAGGICVTLRDLARVGLWVLEQGKVERFEHEGDPKAWAAGDMAPYYPGLPMRYRSKWYVVDAAKGEKAAPLVFGMGIHGQNLFVDRVNGIVIAKLSSQAMPMDAARIALTMRGISELRKRLV